MVKLILSFWHSQVGKSGLRGNKDCGHIPVKVWPACVAVTLGQLTFTWLTSEMSLFRNMLHSTK